MKKFYAIAWLLVSGLTFTSCQSESTQTRQTKSKSNVIYLQDIVTKSDNAQSAFDSLLKEHQLVLVDFFAHWCGPCKRMSPIIDQVAQEFPTVVFLKVDVDRFSQVASGIRSIPVLRLYQNGKQVYSNPGARSKKELESLLKKYA